MKKLSKAYKKLDIRQYESIVAEAQGLLFNMQVYDFEGELIATLNQYSELEIVKHYVDGRFFGFNVYARANEVLTLIDTKDKKKQAKQLINDLKNALNVGSPIFSLKY